MMFSRAVSVSEFSLIKNLNRHIKNVHLKEKPFKCYVCDRSFGYNLSLQDHMLAHTGSKPLSCPVCGETFRFREELKRHTNTFH